MKKLFIAFMLFGALAFPLVGCKSSGSGNGTGNGTGTGTGMGTGTGTGTGTATEKAAVCEKCKKEGKEKCDCPK